MKGRAGRPTLWFAYAVLLCFGFNSRAVNAKEHLPRLLLTPQRLRRLQRDRERQTVRWINFENRVNNVPDSSERGFELALYYAMTHDEKRGREAIQWISGHPCEKRQLALVLDWCGTLLSEQERAKLSAIACNSSSDRKIGIDAIRDDLFLRIVREESLPEPRTGKQIEEFGLTDPRNLYAACEYIAAVRATQHVDVRQDDAPFFRRLPAEFLLAMKPPELDNPGWEAAAAALALVTLDPNLDGSQFLQGWAMEDRQMVREGPGVVYEFLWGDPYLPGVSYRNLDPWLYDPNGLLFARTDWTADACWVSISRGGVQETNCRPGLRDNAQPFGNMTLIPVVGECVEIPHANMREAAVLWRLKPHEEVSYMNGKKRVSSEADAAGLWLLPGYIEGKICRHAATGDASRTPATLRLPR